MDSITKGQRNLLLFILGIAILVLPIRFLAMSNFDDKKSIESQYNERQTYYNSLREKDANRQQYKLTLRSTRQTMRLFLQNFHQSCIRITQSCIYRV